VNAGRATQGGLIVLALWLLVMPPAGAGVAWLIRLAIGALCAAPLLLLLVLGLRAVHQWGVWVAVVMIPYFALSVGALLVSPEQRVEGAAFATLVALVFFSGIAASRQPP
jgi:uncharacterized membrane protein